MANDPIGIATFPGIEKIHGASMDFVHGVSPSIATLTITPQATFPTMIGDLTFSYGKTAVTWKDCRIDEVSYQRNESGFIWQLSIADRRWAWANGVVWGRYNLRREDGSLVGQGTQLTSERTPKELAKLLLNAMGERGYSVNDIPNTLRPEVNWDFVVPSRALAELCDLLGCYVVLGLDNKVKLCVAGEGAQLRDRYGVMDWSFIENPPPKPNKIAIKTAKVRLQVDLVLEPVGKDIDGAIRPIDDLSYAPSGVRYLPTNQTVNVDKVGAPFVDFTWIEDEFQGQLEPWQDTAKKCAKESYFRWYRIAMKGHDGLPERLIIPTSIGTWTIENIEDILPIDVEQVQTNVFSSGDEKKGIFNVPKTPQMTPLAPGSILERTNRPAWVYGKYAWNGPCINPDNTVALTTDPQTVTGTIPVGYSIDTEHGIVKFQQPVYREVDEGGSFYIMPAMLWLRTAICPHEVGTRTPMRFIRWRNTNPKAPKQFVRVVPHEEIVYAGWINYSVGHRIIAFNDNLKKVVGECDYYLDKLENEYDTRTPQIVRYIGIKRIELDGAIRQLTFAIGQDGTFTTVARNSELLDRVIPYRERRRLEADRDRKEFLEKQAHLLNIQQRLSLVQRKLRDDINEP